jgi:membrane fusion protein, macrolide-specific efflux system
MATSETVAAPPPVTDSTDSTDSTVEIPVVDGTSSEHGAPSPRRRWRRRNIIVAAAAIVVLGTVLGVWLSTGSSASSPLEVTTQVVKVTTGTMKQTVSASGTIEPASTADLNFGVSGKVTAVNVATGQTVTAGQTLATVDSSALQVDVESAQASLTSAQDKLTTDQSADAEASQIDSDEASVTTAETQLTTAQTDLADANLTSTIAGTVASVDLIVGQQVSGTDSSSSGSSTTGTSATGLTGASGATTGASTGGSTGASSASSSASSTTSSSSAQITVISTDSYTVSTTVDDTQVGEVKVGDQAVITPENSTTAVYGTVTSVGLVASSSSTVAAFPVTIAVTGSPTGLYAGSTATVSIVTKEITNAVQVPTAAISYSGGNATVTAVVNGSHVVKSVTTGQVSSGYTQITSGLKSGDKVVEQVVKFNASAAGGGRSLFGGSSSSGSTGGFSGRFSGGGGFPGGASGATGGGGFGG